MMSLSRDDVSLIPILASAALRPAPSASTDDDHWIRSDTIRFRADPVIRILFLSGFFRTSFQLLAAMKVEPANPKEIATALKTGNEDRPDEREEGSVLTVWNHEPWHRAWKVANPPYFIQTLSDLQGCTFHLHCSTLLNATGSN